MNNIKIIVNNIIEGDAIKILKQLPDNTFDLSFADPPFNLNKGYSHWNDKLEKDEYLSWCHEWIKELVRVTKETGSIVIHNIPKWLIYISAILNEYAYFRHWISWTAMGAPRGKTLLPVHYGIVFYTKNKSNFKFFDIRVPHSYCKNCGSYIKDYGGKENLRHFFGPLASDVWDDIHRIRHQKRRDKHPCQLPVPLLERIILMTTDVDDIVLDPFIGTGTTAIAARRTGRKYLGIDIDPEYVKIAKSKVAQTNEIKINGIYISVFLNKILTVQDKDVDKIKNYLVKSPSLIL